MTEPGSLDRRRFLSRAAAASVASLATARSLAADKSALNADAEEEGVSNTGRVQVVPEAAAQPMAGCKRDYPASHPVRLLADAFIRWQSPSGRLDPKRCPLATFGHKRSSHIFLATSLYRMYEATGDDRYKEAADRFAVFYMSVLCPVSSLRPAHFGFGLVAYSEFKRHNPKLTDWDIKAECLLEWMKPWRWDKGSWYRNGYPGGQMEDAGNICDNCHAGRGLVYYYALTHSSDALAEAEGTAGYFVRDLKPGTYQGCWSPDLGNWVIAPTTQDRFEHFTDVCASKVAWGYTPIEGVDFLVRLLPITKRPELTQAIPQKCGSAMRWQFDRCQFDDGALGMSGRDDKWLGMTAGGILTYLRARDAGVLSQHDKDAYRPTVLAASKWLHENVTPQSIQEGGYFRVTGRSLPGPPDCRAWQLGWALEALLRSDEV